MLQSRNPTLRRVARDGSQPEPVVDALDEELDALAQRLAPDRMTVEGTVYKTLALLGLTAATTFGVWIWADGQPVAVPFAGLAFFPLLAVGVLTGFRPHLAPVTGPIYAVIAGAFIGVLTLGLQVMVGAELGMLPTQAALATLAVSASMLFAYRTGLIRATPRLRKVVITATLGIVAFYAVNILMSWFGSPMALIWGGGMLPIVLSVAFIVVASLMLILDFDLVAQMAGTADKRMEWYGAFALTTALIWLYIELLRLFALLQRD